MGDMQEAVGSDTFVTLGQLRAMARSIGAGIRVHNDIDGAAFRGPRFMLCGGYLEVAVRIGNMYRGSRARVTPIKTAEFFCYADWPADASAEAALSDDVALIRLPEHETALWVWQPYVYLSHQVEFDEDRALRSCCDALRAAGYDVNRRVAVLPYPTVVHKGTVFAA